MPHNSHNSQNAGGGAVGLSNGVLSTNGNTGIGTTTTAGSSSPSDDLGSTDEVKVFKDEGEQDEEISSQNLLEEKSSLIDLTESEVRSPIAIHFMRLNFKWNKFKFNKKIYPTILSSFRFRIKSRSQDRNKDLSLVSNFSCKTSVSFSPNIKTKLTKDFRSFENTLKSIFYCFLFPLQAKLIHIITYSTTSHFRIHIQMELHQW